MNLPRIPKRLILLFGCAFLLAAPQISAQTETWEPVTSGFQKEIRVWTSQGFTFAKVRLVFPNGGYRVDWGRVTRNGNTFTANARIDRWTGASIQMITYVENTYSLGALEPGTYNFVFKSYGSAVESREFDPNLIAERWEPTTLPGNRVGIAIWGYSGGLTFAKIFLFFPDSGYSLIDWGSVSRSGNEFTIDIKVERFTGESKLPTIRVEHDYELGKLAVGEYALVVKMYGTPIRTQPFSVESWSRRAPRLLTEESSGRVIALDSVTWMRDFPLITTHNFSNDRRARILLLATDIDVSDSESLSSISVYGEDSEHNFYPLLVEHVSKVPGFDWLTQITVKPPDTLRNGGDLWITLNVEGAPSNKALITLKPSETGEQ